MCAPTLCRFSRAYKLLCSKCFFLTKQSNVFCQHSISLPLKRIENPVIAITFGNFYCGPAAKPQLEE